MVLSAVRSLTPWLPSEPRLLPGAADSLLSNVVCRMVPLTPDQSALGRQPAVAAALKQLVTQSMVLRSSTGGWPTDLPQTPENVAPYLSDEIWDLLDALEPMTAPVSDAPSLVPITVLVPHLLWMLASGGYEIMRLIEGVKARVSDPAAQTAMPIVRLVPVLALTLEETSFTLDLVTQMAPAPSLYLSETTELCLLENDLDGQPRLCKSLLEQITDLLGYAQPGLAALLSDGYPVEALRPFQPWQPARLHLHLYLAKMQPQEPAEPPSRRAAASGFTLDDFASTLVETAGDATAGVLGDWLTFTDESWIQTFLSTCAQRVIAQHLAQMTPGDPEVNTPPAPQSCQREAFCNRVTYAATNLVQGTNGPFKHTFVHEPVLVADVWPRLRWYLAQSSEQVMQLMGGVSAQVLSPGLSWQQGRLYLRPLMQLNTANRSWIIDLSRGRLLPVSPQALATDAVVDIADAPWRTPTAIADLSALIDRDLNTYTPAIATLIQGTPIHLHRLDAEAGCQPGQLTLDWCFTLQTTL
ncbi:MAG: hypothetical protein WBA99_09855 [Nodosilinea sp.]